MLSLYLILSVFVIQASVGVEDSSALAGTMPLLCAEPADAGPCRAAHTRFFYNATSGQCESFIYGGCDGTSNRFEALELCQSTCRAGACTAADCLMECAGGYETDASGCKVCSCRSSAASPTDEPVRGCPLIKCPPCQTGQEFEKDANGCDTCECVQVVMESTEVPPKTDCPLIPTCHISCPEGQEKDSRGCPICRCIVSSTEAVKVNCSLKALEPKCDIVCPDGQATDEDGCPLCRCFVPVEPRKNCSLVIDCRIVCPNGREKDANGCPLCRCVETAEPKTNCSLLPNCKIGCPNGQEKDSEGCPICKCIETILPAVNCSLLPNCKIGCPNGQQKDANGCLLCKCIEAVDCPVLAICLMFCPDGQKKDSRGCPICECSVPPPSSKCPPVAVTCTMACPFGFAKNADGCRTCQCQENPCENVACAVGERCRSQLNETSGDYETRCVAVPGSLPLLCLEPAETGRCKAIKHRFFYNVTSGQCESFIYGGCEGTANRFDALEQCQSSCRGGVCSEIQCAMACVDGFETDVLGCKICRCRSNSVTTVPEVFECPLMKCVPCPDGKYKKDARNCSTCECVNPRADKLPCQDPAIACAMYCANGLQKDSNGCTICKCNDVAEPVCPPQPSCTMYCANGQRKDSKGCLLCECIDNVEPKANCSLVPNCKINCPNGQEKDANGCPLCKCNKEVDCPVLVTCHLFCKDGQERDSRGCPICRCSDPPPSSKCPPLQVSCAMACSFGFAKNADGCQICKCQENPCDLMSCGEEERCITQENEAGNHVARCIPGRRWCFEGICRMYCENGFKSDQYGCPRCSCLDHKKLKECDDLSWCKAPCEFGQKRDEHGCRICDCLPNPCKNYSCVDGTVCEAVFFRGCRNCPAVPKCINKTDVKRIYVMLTYKHDLARNLDVDKFALLVAKTLSEAIGLDSSAFFNTSVTPSSKFKTLVSFHMVARTIDLISTAKKLELALASDLTVVTFDLSGVTFIPDQATLTIFFYSNDDLLMTQSQEVESSNDDKVIIAACLIGVAFFVVCVIIMTLLYRRRRRREKENIIYKKAPTKEDTALSEKL